MDLTAANFGDFVGSNKVVLVDFLADLCMPCKMMTPIIDSLQDEVVVGKVNVDQERDLAQKYQITAIPCFLIFKDGEVAKKLVGMKNKKELIDVVNEVSGS